MGVIMRRLKVFFEDYNPYFIFLDIRLYFRLSSIFKQLQFDDRWRQFKLMKGWLNHYGCMISISNTDLLVVRNNMVLAKKEIIPIIDFISEISVDIPNYINVKMDRTYLPNRFKMVLFPRYEVLRFGWWVKMALTIASVVIIMKLLF
jgi:hypothetical protein